MRCVFVFVSASASVSLSVSVCVSLSLSLARSLSLFMSVSVPVPTSPIYAAYKIQETIYFTDLPTGKILVIGIRMECDLTVTVTSRKAITLHTNSNNQDTSYQRGVVTIT